MFSNKLYFENKCKRFDSESQEEEKKKRLASKFIGYERTSNSWHVKGDNNATVFGLSYPPDKQLAKVNLIIWSFKINKFSYSTFPIWIKYL